MIAQKEYDLALLGVAEEVRDFYDHYPYPRPIDSLETYRRLWQDPQRRRADYHLCWPAKRYKEDLSILIAGCGTSQAAKHALRWPAGQITGIDVSATSVRCTEGLKRKYSLNNLKVYQLPIERVNELGTTFDQVVCTGVLHHLANPDAGLRALRGVLKPDGVMHLMVYASYGRTGIYMMQAYCRLLGITPSHQELQDLGVVLNDLPDYHPLTHLLHKGKDFQHPDLLADTLLHPQDRAFSVPEVYEWLDRCGMSFGRWFEQAPYMPQCGVIARTSHAIRLNALPEPAQHAAVELFRGTITQHNFVAFRSDCAAENQPIHFTGEQWRKYIPIRLPWALCISDKVTPGVVAVLLNRAHKHPDLTLPINAAQNHLLDDIDGTRTLSEISQTTGKESVRTLQYFEQLWRYDQIVFDASYAAVAT